MRNITSTADQVTEKATPSASRAPIAIDECGLAQAAQLLADRWTLLILRELFYGVTRFDAIKHDLGLPRSVLSDRLKRLVANGVLDRRPYREAGQRQRYQYVLTPAGIDLAIPMIALMQWGDAHLRNGALSAQVAERTTGAPCHVALVDQEGTEIALRKTKLVFDHDEEIAA